MGRREKQSGENEAQREKKILAESVALAVSVRCAKKSQYWSTSVVTIITHGVICEFPENNTGAHA